MYSFLINSVQQKRDYQFFTYAGRTIDLFHHGAPNTLNDGERFGVCLSRCKNFMRLIKASDPSKVYAIKKELAEKIAASIK